MRFAHSIHEHTNCFALAIGAIMTAVALASPSVMETHTWSKNGPVWTRNALRLILSVVVFAPLLGPLAAKAQQCEGNIQTGCLNENAFCEVGGKSGRCTTSLPKGEKECNCVAAPPPPPPPPPTPDAAITLFIPGTSSCPSASEITPGLKEFLAQLQVTNPDIRPLCLHNGDASRLVILIWSTSVPKGSPEDQARNNSVLPSSISGDEFGVFMTQNFINLVAQMIFKQNHSIQGYPAINLTRLSLDFPGGSTIQTNVYGNDPQFTPTVDFTATTTDQLVPRLVSGQRCEPITDTTCGCKTKSSVNVSDLQEVEVVALMLIPSYFVTNSNAFLDRPGAQPGGGVGCLLYQALPDAISLPETGSTSTTNGAVRAAAVPNRNGGTNVGSPQKMKLVVTYSAVSDIDQGVAFHATNPQIEPRTPAVQISGPAAVVLRYGEPSITINYAALPADFYGTLWYTWSGDPNDQIAAPIKQTTAISFDGNGLGPGASRTQNIKVAVNDSEGSYATTTLIVTVTRGPRPRPHPSR
jgi:hypothetical protein